MTHLITADNALSGRFTGRSRLWKLVFDSALNPLAGGTLTAVVEGSELPVGGTPKMMDNLVATCDGSVYIQVRVHTVVHGIYILQFANWDVLFLKRSTLSAQPLQRHTPQTVVYIAHTLCFY